MPASTGAVAAFFRQGDYPRPDPAGYARLGEIKAPAVLAVGDLGIRRAIERAYGLKELPSAAEVERIGEPWRPYRSLACRYLWRSLHNAPG